MLGEGEERRRREGERGERRKGRLATQISE
jgi:hypothetical protein